MKQISFMWSDTEAVGVAMANWVSLRLYGRTAMFKDCKCLGVLRGGDMIACIIYHHWDPVAEIIEISGAGEGLWLTKNVLFAMYDYPFNALSCQMVFQRNDADDEKLNRQLRRYGFEEYRIRRGRGRDKDELVFTLTEEAWRANGYHPENEAHDEQARLSCPA